MGTKLIDNAWPVSILCFPAALCGFVARSASGQELLILSYTRFFSNFKAVSVIGCVRFFQSRCGLKVHGLFCCLHWELCWFLLNLLLCIFIVCHSFLSGNWRSGGKFHLIHCVSYNFLLWLYLRMFCIFISSLFTRACSAIVNGIIECRKKQIHTWNTPGEALRICPLAWLTFGLWCVYKFHHWFVQSK